MEVTNMTNTIFSRVDHFLEGSFALEDEVLKKATISVASNNMPEHSVSAVQGQFLYFMAKSCQAKRIVEVGTLGGYSTIWLGRSLPSDGYITSIEIDPGFARVAKQNIEYAGLQNKANVVVGAGLDVLKSLETDRQPVDLFFMDADKPSYVEYFQWALKMSRPGSVIIADNVIRDGKVLDAASRDEKVKGVRTYLEMLGREKTVITTVLQTVGSKGHDGIAMSLVI